MTKAPDFPAESLPIWHWAWPDGVTPVWAGCSWEDLSAAHLQTPCLADVSFRTVVNGLKDWKLLRFSLFYILKHGETLLAICWAFSSLFFACGFTASKRLVQNLEHSQFSGCHYTAQWEIHYCCCSLFLSDGDAFFNLIHLFSLACSIICNRRAWMNTT